MAFTQISTDGIKNGTITGSDFATNIDLTDSQKIRFGNSQDLQLFHDGNNSVITAGGAGDLQLTSTFDDVIIQAADNIFINPQGGENGLKVYGDGAVKLYYDGSSDPKFETTSGGAKWTGDLTCDDNNKIRIGSSGDLNLFHDGDDSIIENTTGDIEIRGAGTGVGNVLLRPKTGENGVIVKPDAGVELYYDNSLMLDVKSWGVEINGDLGLDDNRKLALGNLPDLEIYHNGTHSFVDEVGNGNLILRTNPSGTYSTLVLQSGQENSVICNKLGSVELYHISGVGSSSKKFETTSTGAKVLGDFLFRNTSDATQMFFDASNSKLQVYDNSKITFGNNDDLQIYHDGSNNFVRGSHRIHFNSNASITSYAAFDPIDSGTLALIVRKAVNSEFFPCWFANTNGNQGEIRVNAGGGTSYVGASDYRLKENISTITDGITRVKQLIPRRFNWKNDDTKKLWDGFIAHEVSPAVPSAVTGEKDAPIDADGNGYQGMEKAQLLPVLTAALQEAIAKIETLETKVAALEAG